jgi:hypothetical protein
LRKNYKNILCLRFVAEKNKIRGPAHNNANNLTPAFSAHGQLIMVKAILLFMPGNIMMTA